MAGAYVGPLLEALGSIGRELDDLQESKANKCCNGNCNQKGGQ